MQQGTMDAQCDTIGARAGAPRACRVLGPMARTPAPSASAECPAAAAWWRRHEAPTWAVAVAVYAGWGLTTWNYDGLPWWLVLPLGAWFVCWHGSLQHEALHGHPTRRPWLNALIAYPPLWLWLPYPLYRESHRSTTTTTVSPRRSTTPSRIT